MSGGLIQLVSCCENNKDKFNITNGYQTIDITDEQISKNSTIIVNGYQTIDIADEQIGKNNTIIIPRNGDLLSDIYVILKINKLTKKPWKILKNIRFTFLRDKFCKQHI